MIRTRLVWFTTGFVVSGGTIAYFLHRDLSKHRFLLLHQLKDTFGELDSRVSNLESSHLQDGGSSS